MQMSAQMDVLLPDGMSAEIDGEGNAAIRQGKHGMQINPDQAYELIAWLVEYYTLYGRHEAGECFECHQPVPANVGRIYHLADGDVLLCGTCHADRAAFVLELSSEKKSSK